MRPAILARVRILVFWQWQDLPCVKRQIGGVPGEQLPKKWRLEIEKEANDDAGEIDYVLNETLEQLQEECDEHAEITIAHELLCDFEPFAEIDSDNQKVSKLSTLSAALKKELIEWKQFRTSTLNRLRVGSKVVEVTHEHEVQTVLRFFGYARTVLEINEPTFKKMFCTQDVGVTVERYAQWLEDQQLAWSSITNYLSALVAAAQFACVEMESPPPLDQLSNLRRQVQRTRVRVVEAYNKAPPDMRASILKDCVIIHLHSVTPPDRVGVIRKLRWNLSLKREGSDLVIDTTAQRHKTSKFYGPSKTTVSKLVQPWLELYLRSLQLEFNPRDQPYLWCVGGDTERVQTSSQWCQTVKMAFARWSPNRTAVPPKLLRSSFITHLRSSEAAPEDTQASDVYDRETHDRLAKAAFDWCEQVAKQFDAPSPSATPALPVLSGTIECIRTDQQTADGKIIFKATVDWDEQLYLGASIVAQSSISHTIQFTVPVEGASFQLTLQMPPTTAVENFTLSNMKIASGPRPAAAADAAAAPAGDTSATEAGASNGAATSAGPASGASAANGAAASSAEAADSAPAAAPAAAAAQTTVSEAVATPEMAAAAPTAAPATSADSPAAAPPAASRPKPLPIPINGTFVANHKLSTGKSAANSVLFVVDIPWDDEVMYPKAKLSMHVPPVAKMITSTLPSKPRDGKLSITLTLPKAVGTQSFTLGQVSITSGPKPAPRVPQPVIVMPPAQQPPTQQHPVQSMPLQMTNLPVAPVTPQSMVNASLATAAAAANAAAAVRPRPAVVAMPIASQAAPAPAPKPAAPKRKPAAPKRKAAAAAPAAPNARVRRSPPAAAAAQAPAQQQSSRSGRSVKPAQKFGSKGELEGAASSFKSTPLPRRAMPPVSVETSVPAFAMPGGIEIYAYGLHAGVRKRFRAKVLRLRTQYPRIVVKYTATEDGSGTNALELPEMRTAYLTMADIEQINP